MQSRPKLLLALEIVLSCLLELHEDAQSSAPLSYQMLVREGQKNNCLAKLRNVNSSLSMLPDESESNKPNSLLTWTTSTRRKKVNRWPLKRWIGKQWADYKGHYPSTTPPQYVYIQCRGWNTKATSTMKRLWFSRTLEMQKWFGLGLYGVETYKIFAITVLFVFLAKWHPWEKSLTLSFVCA